MMMRSLRNNVKWIMIIVTVVFVLSIFGMYGFRSSRSTSRNEGSDYAVAQVDGKQVMRSTLERALRNYVDRSGIKDITSADIPGLYKTALDSIIIQAALAREVKELDIAATDAEIDEQIKQIEDQFPTKEAFQQYMEQHQINMSELRENLSEQIAQMKLLEGATLGVAVTDEEVKEFYEQTKQLLFYRPEAVMVNVAEFNNRDAAEEALQLLQWSYTWDEMTEIVSSEDIIEATPFDEPVTIGVSSLGEEFAPVKELEEGEFSSVIEVSADDYLLFVNRGHVEETFTPFEEVSGDVRQIVTNQKTQQAQQKYFAEIRDRTTVEILDETLFPKPAEETPEEAVEEAASPDQQ